MKNKKTFIALSILVAALVLGVGYAADETAAAYVNPNTSLAYNNYTVTIGIRPVIIVDKSRISNKYNLVVSGNTYILQ